MDITNAFNSLNWLAIIIAALSTFILGGLWYSSILLGKPWMKVNKMSEEELQSGNMALIFGLSFLPAFFAAFVLALFIGPEADMIFGGMAGFFAGLGWVATFTGIQYLFERKSIKLFLINTAYSIIALTLMSVILGAW